MFTIRTFISPLSTRSASMILAFVCIGLLLGCSGDVASPELHVSGTGFNIRIQDFTAEKIVETEYSVENLNRVNIEAINGEVVVTGHRDVDAVVLTAHLIVGSDSQADADSHIDDLKIQVTESDNELYVKTVQSQHTDGRKYDVKYDIIVPSNFEVLTTQVNGSIEIVDIENYVDVVNVNGDIRLSNTVGSAAADLVNGSIEATVTLSGNETIDLVTDNGSIELWIPMSTSAALGASVGIGAINTSNLVLDDVVQTDQSLTGTLGNGEGVIELRAGNGDINVVGFD